MGRQVTRRPTVDDAERGSAPHRERHAVADHIEALAAENAALRATLGRVRKTAAVLHGIGEELSQSTRAHDLGEACGIARSVRAVDDALRPPDSDEP